MSYTKFSKLHHQNDLLLLGNVWDAQSAKIAESAGFKALGSSSHAIANSLGYADGEQMPVDELLFIVERIVKSVKIPVSVDFESGYSDDPDQVAKYVKQLVELGVAGINLEDGKVVKSTRTLGKATLLSDKIAAIKALTKNIFINARTDTYTTKHETALEETLKRAQIYDQAGADGFFVPLAETKVDIEKIVNSTRLPLNLFLTDKLPKAAVLTEIGVKRLSHGAKIYAYLVAENTKLFHDFLIHPKLPK
ncbi:isocitrate lyase/PEP mutase family protein [Sphingobacterium faecium]|uniref:isocitrate lyase/PEP mutase family protein n=1 Tax=Sphingobacterium faecium TaxID=34087 RepID=UPI002469A465|nr:isocitrate lyase/phosphoenolpyruvate mutase family protein [Sphingobacterium faecium]MDH5827281.1 isocitrate lyase/phosphoenolpyruvate mutase family protein [Sphingobacterium faecium]